MVVCLVLHLSMSCVKSRESAHARQKYAMWKKTCFFFKLSLYMPFSLFKPIVAEIGDMIDEAANHDKLNGIVVVGGTKEAMGNVSIDELKAN